MTKRGFTLVELLVVVGIILILAAVVATNVFKARSKGRDARRVADLISVKTALESYNQKNGSYPVTGNRGSDCTSDCIIWKQSSLYPNTWVPNLSEELSPLPVDPINQTTTSPWYSYAYGSPTGQSYKIIEYNFESADYNAKKTTDGGNVNSWYEIFSYNGKDCQQYLSTCP